MGHLVYPLEGRPCALETAALSEPGSQRSFPTGCGPEQLASGEVLASPPRGESDILSLFRGLHFSQKGGHCHYLHQVGW